MAIWEWLDDEGSSKALVEFIESPTSSGTYGRKIIYDLKRPKYTVTLAATGMSYTETETEIVKYTTPGTNYTYDLVIPYGGTVRSISGIVNGYRRERMRGLSIGSDALYKMTLTITRTDQ